MITDPFFCPRTLSLSGVTIAFLLLSPRVALTTIPAVCSFLGGINSESGGVRAPCPAAGHATPGILTDPITPLPPGFNRPNELVTA